MTYPHKQAKFDRITSHPLRVLDTLRVSDIQTIPADDKQYMYIDNLSFKLM